MGFLETFLGKKTHCIVCGQPIREINPLLQAGPYCSELCQKTIARISSRPPQPSPVDPNDPNAQGNR